MRQCIVRKIVFLEKTFRTMHNLMISYGRGKRSHCKSENQSQKKHHRRNRARVTSVGTCALCHSGTVGITDREQCFEQIETISKNPLTSSFCPQINGALAALIVQPPLMRGWPEPEKVGTFQRNLERNLGVTQLPNAAPSKQRSRAATSRSLGRDAASAGSAGWLLQQPRDGASFWRCTTL